MVLVIMTMIMTHHLHHQLHLQAAQAAQAARAAPQVPVQQAVPLPPLSHCTANVKEVAARIAKNLRVQSPIDSTLQVLLSVAYQMSFKKCIITICTRNNL